jgi:hypothetical protein
MVIALRQCDLVVFRTSESSQHQIGVLRRLLPRHLPFFPVVDKSERPRKVAWLAKGAAKFDVNERLFISPDGLYVVARLLGKLSAKSARRPLLQLRFRLFQPVRHTQVAVHRFRLREVFLRKFVRTGAPVELAETGMTVCDQRTHSEFLGKRERVTIVAFGFLQEISAGGDIAEKPEGPRLMGALTVIAGKGQGAPADCDGILEPVGGYARIAHNQQQAGLVRRICQFPEGIHCAIQ